MELTQIPTAAGAEDRVIAWVDRWIAARSGRLEVRRDDVGNILVTQRRHGGTAGLILATAHLDHPAFVVTGVADGILLGTAVDDAKAAA